MTDSFQTLDNGMAVVPNFSVLGSTFEVDPEPIGVGAFGTVHFAMMRIGSNQKAVAVKCIDKARTRAQAEAGGARTRWEELISCEVDITSELGQTRHRNMPRFFGKWEDLNHVHLVLQLCEGGELPGWLLEQKSAYSERLASRITYDALQAVLCCHDLGIVHRDLKPQNLLFTSDAEDARLLLVDFGLATRMEMGGPRLSEMCGTLDYMAPEMLQGSYDERVDVWAVGVLLHLLLTGSHPFRGPSQSATQERILSLELDMSSALYHDVSPDALDMLRLLLSSQPGLRPSARAALKHAWLRRRNDQAAPLLPERIPAQLMAVCNQENWWVGSSASFDGRSVENGSSIARSPSPVRVHQRGSTGKSLLQKSLSMPKFARPGGFVGGAMRGKTKEAKVAGSGLGDELHTGAAAKRRKADATSNTPGTGAAYGHPAGAAGATSNALRSSGGARSSSSGELALELKRTSSAAEQQLHWLKLQVVEFEEADEMDAAAEDVQRAAAGARLAELLSTVQQRKVEVYYKKRVLGRLALPRWQPAMLSHYSEDESLFLTIGAKPCRKLIQRGGSLASRAPAHELMPGSVHGSCGSVLLGKGLGGPDVRLPISEIESVSKIAGSELRLQHAGEAYRLRLRDAAAANDFASALQARITTNNMHTCAAGRDVHSPPPRRESVERSPSLGRATPTVISALRSSRQAPDTDSAVAVALAEAVEVGSVEAAKAKADAEAAEAEAALDAEAEAMVEAAVAAAEAEAVGSEGVDDGCIPTAAFAAALLAAAEADHSGGEATPAPHQLEREPSARRLQTRSKPFWALKESKSSASVCSLSNVTGSEAEAASGFGAENEESEPLAAALAARVTQTAVQSAISSALPEESDGPHNGGAGALSGDAGAANSSAPGAFSGVAGGSSPFLGGVFRRLGSLFLLSSTGEDAGQVESAPVQADASPAAGITHPPMAAALPDAPAAAPSAPAPTAGGAPAVAGASTRSAFVALSAAAASPSGDRLSMGSASSLEVERGIREERTSRIFTEIAKRESSRGSPISRHASAGGSQRASVSSTTSGHALDSSRPHTPESVRAPAAALAFTGGSRPTPSCLTRPTQASETPSKPSPARHIRLSVPYPPPRAGEANEPALSPSKSRNSVVVSATAPPLIHTSNPPQSNLACASTTLPPQHKVSAPSAPMVPPRRSPPLSAVAGARPRKPPDMAGSPATPSPANALVAEKMDSQSAHRLVSSSPPRPPSLPAMPVSPSDALTVNLRKTPPSLRSVPLSPPRSRTSLPDVLPGLDSEWAAAGSPNREKVPVGDFTVMWEQLMANVSQQSIHGSSIESPLRSPLIVRRAGSAAVASTARERKVSLPEPPVVVKAQIDTWGAIRDTVRERKSMKGLQHRNSSPMVVRGAKDNHTMREQQHTVKGLLHHQSLPSIARAEADDTWSSIAESIRQRKLQPEDRSWSRKEAAATPPGR